MGQWDGTTEQDSGMGHFKQGPRTMGHEMGHGTFGELEAHGTAQWPMAQGGTSQGRLTSWLEKNEKCLDLRGPVGGVTEVLGAGGGFAEGVL